MPTFDTPESISVTVEIGVGDLRLVARDRADTVVEVRPSNPDRPSDVSAAQKTRVEYANGVLQIKAPRGWKIWGGGESIDVLIELPTSSQLRGEVGMAPLRATGTLGECSYRTGAGDIIVENVAGTAELTTGTGVIRVDRIGGSATIRNNNGATWIGEVVGDLQAKAANGKIAVGQARDMVRAKSASGDIQLDEVSRSTIVAETGLGRVDVGVRSGTAAWLDLQTRFGHVHNQLSASAQPQPSEDSVEVRARTSFGDITIRRTNLEGSGQGAEL